MRRTTSYAAMLATGYLVVGVSYILVSSHLAASSSRSVEELRTLEMLKGAAYMGVTALMIFAVARVLLARVQTSADELLRQQRALLTNERRIYAGLIASSMAHDSNNVLAQLMAELEFLKRTDNAEERGAIFQSIDGALARVVSINRRLQSAGVDAARPSRQKFELGEMAAGLVQRLRSHPKLRGKQVTVVHESPAEVMLEPVVVDQILTNLVLNAADASKPSGRVEVKVGRTTHAYLEVHDDGPGVPRERRAGLFSALETTKPDGNGLGLFSVNASAKSVGGSVSVGDSPLGGARFRVELPLAG
ncbi:MAG: HAMP domain-containing sensor histidine kinase [Myxococcaceae bacterium]